MGTFLTPYVIRRSIYVILGSFGQADTKCIAPEKLQTATSVCLLQPH